jgi:LPXTG-site transpeptidase (sortase) family protein
LIWSWRDLRVFLFLFVFSLLIWTTRLMGPGFDPYRPASPPQMPAAKNDLPASTEHQPAFPLENATSRQEKVRSHSSYWEPNPQPDFAPPGRVKAIAPAESPGGQTGRDEQFYRLVVPALRVDSDVIPVPFNGETWDVSGLGQEVGLLETQELLASNRNLAIAGHFSLFGPVPGPFRYLSRLVPGARIYLYSDRNLYIYQVQDQQVVTGTDLSVLEAGDETRLTLLTCETWDEKTKQFLRRRAVRASLMHVIPLSPAGLE